MKLTSGEEDCAKAFAYGMMAVEPGLDLLCLGEMGIANTTSAAALCCALFGGSAAEWVGPGTGVAGEALARKIAVVDEAMALHRPQFATDEARTTSQPLAASPSQSPHPASQRSPQAPAAQAPAACGRAGHATPHAPQFVADAARSTSQPLAALPSQSAKPDAHTAIAHAPAEQVAPALA